MPFDQKIIKLQKILGIIFNFESKTITWQDISITMKPPNCMANKFFVIKESRPV